MGDAVGGAFCCSGCEAVHALLAAEGLERYYDLRGDAQSGANTRWGKSNDHKWLERLEAELPTVGAVRSITLDVQGIHCAACVWLFEELFRREEGGIEIAINPALGSLRLSVAASFSLPHYVEAIERFGYLLGPALKERTETTRELLFRTGASIAIAMNAMIFAVAIYAGLDRGPIWTFFHSLTFGLASLSVLVGGTVFFRSAWQALRQRVLHLDVPIALGIVLAYAGSAYAFFFRSNRATYFDTVSVFIALMLVGRFLQERIVERNRRQLLAADGADNLLTRVNRAGATKLIRCSEIQVGDRLVIAPSDLIPVPGLLASATASISLDWINGESAPREVRIGDAIPAGAFNVGRSAVTVVAASLFESSPIVALLRTPRDQASDRGRSTRWWQHFTRVYVSVVLSVAALAFATWLFRTHDVARALEVTTAVLVITCPCAFGIATPMAYELVQAGLRRAGVFIRSASFLDRAVDVTRVVFDKTGTLTTGDLAIVDTLALDELPVTERRILYNLAARSTHPKSVAIARHLRAGCFDDGMTVHETAGAGLETTVAGDLYRLGAVRFARAVDDAPESGVERRGQDVLFTKNGQTLASFCFRETLRNDAQQEVAALRNDGYDVWILSGDATARAKSTAARVGIAADHAVGDASPEAKAEWLDATDHEDTMMIGDGLNDGLAVERAFVSATPAIDRPFMPARTDFYFTTAGLRPVRLSLKASRALRRVTRTNLCFAVAYNVVTVGLAFAGVMTPLLCAVVMPLSSLSIVGATIASLSSRSPLWKS